jgi:biopolymer transport protein TolR
MKSLFSRKQSYKPIAEINIVPYVDVMLVLLVIFMVTAPLINQGVEVNLPVAAAKPLPQKDEPPLVVTVDQTGLLFLNVSETPRHPITPKHLQIRVAAETQRDPKRVVVVRGDQVVPYSKVLDAMVLLQKAGVSHVALETKQVETSS